MRMARCSLRATARSLLNLALSSSACQMTKIGMRLG